MMGMEKYKTEGWGVTVVLFYCKNSFYFLFFSGTEEEERHVARSRVRCNGGHTNGNVASLQSKSDIQGASMLLR